MVPVRPRCKMVQCKPDAHQLNVSARLKGAKCDRKAGLAKRTMQILKDGSSSASTWLDRAISIDPDPRLTATCKDELLPGCLPIKEPDWEGVNKVLGSGGPELEAVQVLPTLLRHCT